MNIDAADAFMAIFGFKRVEEGDSKMSTGIKPVASDDDIIEVFKELIDDDENGSTTTLEVKNTLRDRQYWVKQDEVSETIRSYVEYEDASYDFTISGNHRVYAKVTTLPSWVGKPKAVAKISTWKCSAPGVPTDAYYSNMTRNQARYRFSQEYGVPYVKTSATVAQ